MPFKTDQIIRQYSEYRKQNKSKHFIVLGKNITFVKSLVWTLSIQRRIYAYEAGQKIPVVYRLFRSHIASDTESRSFGWHRQPIQSYRHLLQYRLQFGRLV